MFRKKSWRTSHGAAFDNMIPVTLGNIVGASLWPVSIFVYRREPCLSNETADPSVKRLNPEVYLRSSLKRLTASWREELLQA